jgi:hypothetical protein
VGYREYSTTTRRMNYDDDKSKGKGKHGKGKVKSDSNIRVATMTMTMMEMAMPRMALHERLAVQHNCDFAVTNHDDASNF